MDKMIMDLTPNMYDGLDKITNIEESESMAIISLEDLGEDQTIGDDNLDEPLPPADDNFIFDDEDDQEEDVLEEGDELTVFENEDEEDEEELDDTGFNDDDYEDMSENQDFEE